MSEGETTWNLAIIICAMSITASLHKMQRACIECIERVNAATTRFYANF